MTQDRRLDKRAVRRVFTRAAAAYDHASHLEREVMRRLLEHLDPVRLEPARILDVGVGTGASTRALAARYRKARVTGIDVSSSMLSQARRAAPRLWPRQSYACTDAEQLALAGHLFGLVFSNLALPWCNEPARVLAEALRVLQPGGLMALSTYGPDTLRELRESWEAVDTYPHVHHFLDMHDLGDALSHAGFGDIVVDAERITVRYSELESLFRDLRQSGAVNISQNRRRTLTGPGRAEGMRRAYHRHRIGKDFPATFELVYAHAWSPETRRAVEVPAAVLHRSTRVRG